MAINNGERGVALLIVLSVTVLLAVMASGFIAMVRREARGVANYRQESQAYFLARSGVSLAVDRLVERRLHPGLKHDGAEEEQWILDGTPNRFSLGDKGFVEISITDESGKVDLNRADKTVLQRVLIAMDIGEEQRSVIVASILDWLDDNNFHRLNGAEDDYYGSLAEPYESKDGPMSIVEELLWVRGVTPELFYGSDGDGPGAMSYGEEPRRKAGLGRLFTVFTGNVGVNVNTAPFEVLLSIPGFDEHIAGKIVDARRYMEFKSLNDLGAIGVKPAPALSKYITFASAGLYTVIATGGLEESPARYSVKAVVEITKGARCRVLYWKDQETLGGGLI